MSENLRTRDGTAAGAPRLRALADEHRREVAAVLAARESGPSLVEFERNGGPEERTVSEGPAFDRVRPLLGWADY